MADEISDFLADPNGENFLRLRTVVGASPAYEAASEGDERLAELIAAGDYDQATELAADLMPNWLLSARVHRLASVAAEGTGDSEAAARERYLWRACARGLLLAGDGTPERPYPILHVSDEYELLDVLGKEPTGQRVVEGREGPCDVITCDDGSQVWFDITASLRNQASNIR